VDEFRQGDVLDRAIVGWLRDFQPDTVVHLAFAVDPGRDERGMHAVNVDGTRTVLDAAVDAGVGRVLVASSGTVYGAWPGVPQPHDESSGVRPRPEYYYSRDKGIVEELVAEFAAAHPAVAVSWTRPTIICGPGLRNFLSDLFLHLPFMILPDGADTPLQFVHEDDVAAATVAILRAAGRGPFNVAPADAVTQRDLARMMGVAAVPVPFFLVALASRAWWALRLPLLRTPPGLIHYLRHPWLMSSERLRRECGFEFNCSSREAFATLLAPVAPHSRGWRAWRRAGPRSGRGAPRRRRARWGGNQPVQRGTPASGARRRPPPAS
jgi:UDP-glucose 4-epimerase